MQTKKCPKCQIEKSAEEFSKRSASKDELDSWCKQCVNESTKKWKQKNPDKIKKYWKEYQQQNKEKLKEYEQQNVLKIAFNGARDRAKKKGLDFDITLEWLQERYTGFCELTGIEFAFIDEGRSPISPSLDRIDSSKGYTVDNVRIISWSMNMALGPYGIERYEQNFKAYLREQGYEIIKKNIDK